MQLRRVEVKGRCSYDIDAPLTAADPPFTPVAITIVPAGPKNEIKIHNQKTEMIDAEPAISLGGTIAQTSFSVSRTQHLDALVLRARPGLRSDLKESRPKLSTSRFQIHVAPRSAFDIYSPLTTG
jgi:hypothetical protein